VIRASVMSYAVRRTAARDETREAHDARWHLMRQIGSLPATPVIDGVENVQFSYDIFDDDAANPGGTLKTNNKTANGSPGLIRKINVALSIRSTRRVQVTKDFSRMTLVGAVSPRNLSFQDRYK